MIDDYRMYYRLYGDAKVVTPYKIVKLSLKERIARAIKKRDFKLLFVKEIKVHRSPAGIMNTIA